MCVAVILAGGAGRRLGGAVKPLLSLGHERIIDRQLTTLRSVVDHVAIVAASPPDVESFQDLGAPVWVDERPGLGPLGGILTALVKAQTAHALVVAGDMPFLTAPFLKHLLGLTDGVDAVIPRLGTRYQPLCGVYRRTCLAAIRRRLDTGQLAVTEFLADIQIRVVAEPEIAAFNPDHTLFFNVNTPTDYARGVELASDRERTSADTLT
jgi:molybdopterin-guanine dinucleotide biosynthesis protein A